MVFALSVAAGGSLQNQQALLMNAAMMSVQTTGEKITPQEAVRRQMEAMQQKVRHCASSHALLDSSVRTRLCKYVGYCGYNILITFLCEK